MGVASQAERAQPSDLMAGVRLILVTLILLSGMAGPVSGQVGGCHTCHYNISLECYTCIHYQFWGYNYCAQPSCSYCEYGGGSCWTEPDGLAVLKADLLAEDQSMPRSPVVRDLIASDDLSWTHSNLKRVRGILARHNLVVREDGRIAACQGDVGFGLDELRRAVAQALHSQQDGGLSGQLIAAR